MNCGICSAEKGMDNQNNVFLIVYCFGQGSIKAIVYALQFWNVTG